MEVFSITIDLHYAGIGSRETPGIVIKEFIEIGTMLAEKGYILRSGAAEGSDSAFEKGCDIAFGRKEIYIPWGKPRDNQISGVTQDAFDLASKYHPYFYNLKIGARKLIARNGYQILGSDLKTPSKFVVCYTEDGKDKGGTAQGLRIARANNIPIFNAGLYDRKGELKQKVLDFIKL